MARSNTTSVPEAKSAMNRFKYEVASELGVPLSDGYNGNLTSKQNGSVGGYMVKKMIEAQERQMADKYAYPTQQENEESVKAKRPGWRIRAFVMFANLFVGFLQYQLH